MTDMRPVVKRIACLCVLLTLWSAMAFASHVHLHPADAARCSICVAAHSASPAPPAAVVPIPLLTIADVPVQPVRAAMRRLAIFALSVRPPPKFRLF